MVIQNTAIKAVVWSFHFKLKDGQNTSYIESAELSPVAASKLSVYIGLHRVYTYYMNLKLK